AEARPIVWVERSIAISIRTVTIERIIRVISAKEATAIERSAIGAVTPGIPWSDFVPVDKVLNFQDRVSVLRLVQEFHGFAFDLSDDGDGMPRLDRSRIHPLLYPP